MELEKEILKSLWYRLGRHGETCTQEQVTLAVRMQALNDGETPAQTALLLYWLIREGHKGMLPEIFTTQLRMRG